MTEPRPDRKRAIEKAISIAISLGCHRCGARMTDGVNVIRHGITLEVEGKYAAYCEECEPIALKELGLRE